MLSPPEKLFNRSTAVMRCTHCGGIARIMRFPAPKISKAHVVLQIFITLAIVVLGKLFQAL